VISRKGLQDFPDGLKCLKLDKVSLSERVHNICYYDFEDRIWVYLVSFFTQKDFTVGPIMQFTIMLVIKSVLLMV